QAVADEAKHERAVRELEEDFAKRRELLVEGARVGLEEAVTEARAAAEGEARRRVREAEERAREDARREAKEAAARKEREMNKALKAAARLTLKSQRDAQASLESRKARMAEGLDQRLRNAQETHLAEKTEELRGQAERLTREAAAAVAKVEAESRAAVATSAAAAEEQAELLRGRLERVPGEVRAELEREFQEKERLVREGMQQRLDSQAAGMETLWRAELERSLALRTEELEASHEASLKDATAAAAAEREDAVRQVRAELARSEEACRSARESAAAS
ncbi:unnamed protein product, partial [Ectocarpus sp. 8 AP-2014]